MCNAAGLCATAGPLGGNKIDSKAPANPTGVVSTDPTPGTWSRDRQVSMAFGPAADGGSGVDGLSYAWTTAAVTAPDRTKDLEEDAAGLASPTLGKRALVHRRQRRQLERSRSSAGTARG